MSIVNPFHRFSLCKEEIPTRGREMPRQNRVTPFGKIIAVPDRGMFMGNRGALHDAHGQLTSQRWTRNAWVICRLSFNGVNDS